MTVEQVVPAAIKQNLGYTKTYANALVRVSIGILS